MQRLIFVFLIVYVPFAGILAADKEPAIGKNGMVSSSSELATEIGIQILKRGGNAVDAAVAVGYTLAVVHPAAGNIGGGGFMVILFPDGARTGIDFREKAPQNAHRDMFLDDKGELVPNRSTLGYLAAGVPGSVAGLNMALEKYGKLKLADVIEPAIQLAQNGFPLSVSLASSFKAHADEFKLFPASAKKFLKKDGYYQPGDTWRQPDLAATLKLIKKKGTAGFYRGKLAKRIANDMKKNGGLITLVDLQKYQPVERQPVVGSYNDYEIIAMGPPSSGGITLLEMFNILEHYDLDGMNSNSAEYLHLLTETMRRAFADRAVHLGDADFYPVPISGLIHKKYAEILYQSIRLDRASAAREIAAGNPIPFESDHTTHYCVADKDQMVVAVTTTINTAFGAKVVVAKTGFLLNNEMDDFSARPGVPNVYGLVGSEANAIAPQKRMLSSMAPTILTRNNKFFMTVGAQGGPRIITTVLQTILNVIHHGMNIQQAVDAPRIHHQWLPDSLLYEPGLVPDSIMTQLKNLGHQVRPLLGSISEAEAILYDADSQVYTGAADSRHNGVARGY